MLKNFTNVLQIAESGFFDTARIGCGKVNEKTGANTRAVFGDYISIYDIQRAVADKATVPIYYESRIAKLGMNASELPKLDAEFEEITEGEEQTKKESRAA